MDAIVPVTSDFRLTHAQLEGILSIADDAIVSMDAMHRIVFFNRGAELVFGYTAAEVIGQPLEMLLPERYRQIHRAHVSFFDEAKGSSRRMGERGEIIGRRKDGAEFPAEASISRLVSDDKALFTAILRDVTERHRQNEELRCAKEEAEAATKAKSMFLANMSHEIRTPLNAVIGMTGLLLDTTISEEQKDYAETIRASGEALLAIINDILDYSKIELGRLELERQPFDLRRLIEESLDLLAPAAAEKNLNLAYLIDDSVPATVVSDVTRLRQILVNLLSNATKFTARGEVLLSVDATALDGGDQRIHFAVRDTGIGIPEDRLGHLFQSFSQVDASTTRKYGGSGLGLAISRRLAEMMDGSMWVESHLGHGSTFHLALRVQAGGKVLAQNYLQDRSAVMTGRRMLVVDDNMTNRRILVKQALLWGMLPSAAASGAEALDLIRHGHMFDVAILDMSMPEMDGLALALEIRRHRTPGALPLVMLTSMANRAKSRDVDRVGFAAYLNKPIKPTQLFDVLLNVMNVSPSPTKVADDEADGRLADELPLSILVAEDNAINQKVMVRMLAHLGYRADLAASGVEALDAVERQCYDVILMDVHMPEMDGLEASRRLRARFASGQGPRIIAMTANAMPGDRENCLAAGMDGYLSKPIERRELRAALAGVMPARHVAAGDASSPGDAPVDPRRIESLRRMDAVGGVGLLADLIDTFVEDSPGHLAQLEQAASEGDAAGLKQAAHRYRSSVANLGASRMSAICAELERVGESGHTEAAADLLAQLGQEYERVIPALHAQRRGQ